MELSPLSKIILMAAALLVVLRLFLATSGAKKARRRGMFHGGPGAGASGAFYEMLNEDKRKAIEIIVEEKAGARDEETADDIVDPDEAGVEGRPKGGAR